MLIKNACIENNEELKCIRIEDGKFKEIKKDLEPYAQEEVMDLEGETCSSTFCGISCSFRYLFDSWTTTLEYVGNFI